MTRRWPACSDTKSRPSGAKAIAVGFVRPFVTGPSVKPGGYVAAAAVDTSSDHRQAVPVTTRHAEDNIIVGPP